MINSKIFAKRLKEARENNDLRQNALANLVGIAPQTISIYEKGDKLPTLENAAALAESLNVSLDWLLGLSDGELHINTAEDIVRAINSIQYKIGSDFILKANEGSTIIYIYAKELVAFFQKDAKMDALLMEETIDADLYHTWRSAEMEKLRDIAANEMTSPPAKTSRPFNGFEDDELPF